MQSVRFVFRTICPPLIKAVRTICLPYGLSKANQSVQFVSVQFVQSPYDLSSVRFVCRPIALQFVIHPVKSCNYNLPHRTKEEIYKMSNVHFHFVTYVSDGIDYPVSTPQIRVFFHIGDHDE